MFEIAVVFTLAVTWLWIVIHTFHHVLAHKCDKRFRP